MKYIDYVNIKQGTDSIPSFSQGNTLPLTQLPFSMASFSPQTTSNMGRFFFHPRHRVLEGVRLTHQPSPWIGDFGAIVLMPQEGEPRIQPNQRVSSYRPQDAVYRPDYLKLAFQRYNAVMELAPTERGGMLRLNYNGDLKPRFAVLPISHECGYTLHPDKRMLTGYTRQHVWPVVESFAMYFAIEFDCDIDVENSFLTSVDGELQRKNQGVGDCFGYNVALTEKQVTARLAISYISVEQAEENLRQELQGKSFDEIRDAACDLWESYLSRIQVEASEEKKKTFYSCLYRMFLYPNKFHELDEKGNVIHFNTYDGTVGEGVLYTNNGFWDTFRTVYPLFALIAPEMYEEILQGYVNSYKDTGWLPKWPSAGEVGMMPGTLIDAVIGHAAATGAVSDKLLKEAYEAALKHVYQQSNDPKYGRHGTDDYNRYGYIPREKYHESVNHTLDYVYGDFCLAQVANKLGDRENEQRFLASAQNYKKLFDPETGFMRGRDSEGKMADDFDPYRWGCEYCEGSAWQNSFGVYHDMLGLAELYGGKDRLIAKLDELFAALPRYNVGGYGNLIHEMSEMAAQDFGQCAISNQPSFHLPYMFAVLGEKAKTEFWVEKIVNEAFSSGDDGFPGDDDNGTMSGWYIFSVMGFYPICPGKAEYVKSKMLVDSVKIRGHEICLDDFDGDVIAHSDMIRKIQG